MRTITILYKGGGKATTVEAIPAWAKPYIKSVGDSANAAYTSGSLSKVAGSNANMNTAFGSAATNIGSQTAAGMTANNASRAQLGQLAKTGGVDKALQDAAILQGKMNAAQIGGEYAARGTLGSARQANAVQNSNAQLQATLAKEKFGNQMAATQALNATNKTGQELATGAASAYGQLGQAQRTVEQSRLDAPWQGLERYASAIYGNPARQQGVAGGGGK
jgi:hypothetical protein